MYGVSYGQYRGWEPNNVARLYNDVLLRWNTKRNNNRIQITGTWRNERVEGVELSVDFHGCLPQTYAVSSFAIAG